MSGSSNKCECEIFFVVSVFECLKCEYKSVSNMFLWVCVCVFECVKCECMSVSNMFVYVCVRL